MEQKDKYFNIFTFLKVSKSENIYSQFIASLLEYDNKTYLESFLKRIGVEKDYINLENVNIITEKTLQNRKRSETYGRADIWIGEGKKKNDVRNRIIIENKLFAGDQWLQLSRYNDYLHEEKAKRSGYLIYLTLEGKNPSGQSIKINNGDGTVRYLRVSYHKNVLPWLNFVQAEENKSMLSIMIRQFIDIIESKTKAQEFFNKHENKSIESEEFKNTKISKSEFKSTLELYFWNKLSDKLLENKTISIDYRRLYSWDKIYKKHDINKIERAYGIVAFNKNKQKNKIRLKIDNSFTIRISQGNFIEESNSWEGKDLNLIEKIDLLKFNTKKDIDNWFIDNLIDLIAKIKLFLN